MTKKEQHEPYLASVLEGFGGIGAGRIALNNLYGDCKVKTVDYIDILNWAVHAYNKISPTCYLPQSIVDWKLGVNIFLHGSPCQDFSIAGKGKGGELGSNTQSSLLWQSIDIISNRLPNKPEVVIWENVTGVLNKNHKPTFDKYLKTMEELGYQNQYSILNGIDFGIPQRRKRVFVVSILKGTTRYEHFNFENLRKQPLTPLSEFLEENVDIKYYIKQKSMANAIKLGKIKIVNKVVETITTKQMRWNNARVLKIPILECNKEFNYTLSNGDKLEIGKIKSNGSVNIPWTTFHSDNVIDTTQKSCKTIRANGRNVISIPIVESLGKGDFVWYPRESDGEAINGSYNRAWKSGKPVGTISSQVPIKICEPITKIDNKFYEIKLDQDENPIPIFMIENKPYYLRILTEREAWRLMGFRDEHFDKVKDLPSTALYHLAGNSMIVQVMEAIFEHLLWKGDK